MLVKEVIDSVDKNKKIQIIDIYNRNTFVGQAYLDDIDTTKRTVQIKYFRNIDTDMEQRYHAKILNSKAIDVVVRNDSTITITTKVADLTS